MSVTVVPVLSTVASTKRNAIVVRGICVRIVVSKLEVGICIAIFTLIVINDVYR